MFFFVISGFLITSNILRENEKENFSIKEFYDKRARRILPALIFTILICTCVSLAIMLPYELKNFGQSIVASLIGLNNILLFLTSGYWSLAAELKPLYHTWSLAVEEQYYFLIPLLIITLKKRRYINVTLWILCFISWLACFLSTNKEFSFLMLLTRFWELCIGSILALHINKFQKKNNLISIFGIFLILTSFTLPHISEYQAINNLPSVIGTALIIAFTPADGYIPRIFSNNLIKLIGLSSYSIYLLHQPFLSFYRLASEGKTDPLRELLIAFLAIPFGIIMWKFIENTLRDRKIIKNQLFYGSLSICFTLMIIGGFTMHNTYGLQEKIENFKKYSYGNNPQAYADIPYKYKKDKYSTTNNKILIIGNSFARDFCNAITEIGLTNGYEIAYTEDINSSIQNGLINNADIVFCVSSEGMASIEPNMDNLIKKSQNIKKQINKHCSGKFYYVGTKNYGHNNNFIRMLDWDSNKNYMVKINDSNIKANDIEKELYKENYIDLLSLTRNDNKTRLFTDNHKFISFDTDHITKDGALYLGKLLIEQTDLKNLILK